jgi:hypothetical protein
MAKMEVGFLQLGTGCVFVAASTVIKFPTMLGLKIKDRTTILFLCRLLHLMGLLPTTIIFLEI